MKQIFTQTSTFARYMVNARGEAYSSEYPASPADDSAAEVQPCM